MSQLDIIIPVYNEAENINDLFLRLDKALTESKISYQVIFVDDHSTDGTTDEIYKLPSSKVKLLIKSGKKGKAYSILEGIGLATSDYIVMIDGDLQYPPEAIVEMYNKAKSDPNLGVVVANRVNHKAPLPRRLFSKINRVLIGKMLLGFDCDIQSGLKIFKKEIISYLSPEEVSGWSIDVPLLNIAHEIGYKIGTINIDFAKRANGETKVKFFETTREIVVNALKVRFTRNKVYHFSSSKKGSMLGAGVTYKKKRFVTHTTLNHKHSAIKVLSGWQKFGLVSLLIILISLLVKWPLATAVGFIGFLSAVYFVDTVFNLFLVLKSLSMPPELTFSENEVAALDDKGLPVYTILCPLYKEASVLPTFVENISKLDWPKNKLDVLLLLEEDDKETQDAARKMDLPSYVRTLVVPDSQPKTKPKACNYGLSFAKGEYVVIYDAEDRPDTDQLKKAYLAFQNVGENVACLQAKLNYFNPHDNFLTRLFTAEYSLWFDITLTGLQSINTVIPLGGTSNHFRTNLLKKLEGWDPFNVTEDCDLGVRLFKEGYKTAIIDSTTLEEANSNVGNWIRQRSRWIKGYIQTYFVHMRNPIKLVRDQGWHALLFQLTVGGKIAFIFINPFLWIATIAYFTLYKFVGPTIQSVYPAPVFYLAITSLVFGNFFFLYYYMIGCAKRGHWSLIKFVFLVPFYWLMVSVAGFKALIQLIYKPHYWEKTNHGLNLAKINDTKAMSTPSLGWFSKLQRPGVVNGGLLIIASVVANFFNFLYNAYLGRSSNVSLEQFGLISLIGSLLYVIQIPAGALAGTVTYRSAFLLGKHNAAVKKLWLYLRKRVFPISIVITLLWLLGIPLLTDLFHSDSWLPFILFTPIFVISLVNSVDDGFLGGNHKFQFLAFLAVLEAVSKFALTVVIVQLGLSRFVYLAIPISLILSFIAAWIAANSIRDTAKSLPDESTLYFPRKFFATSLLVKLSSVAFLSLDVILAKVFFSPTVAGQYALISLVGKMVYFVGSLFSQFITPVVSRVEGAGENSRNAFNKLLAATVGSALLAFVAVGVFGHITVPLLFGAKSIVILPYLPWFCLSMVFFTIASNLVSYHQIRKHYSFVVLGSLLAILELAVLSFFHTSLQMFVFEMLALSITYLISVFVLQIFVTEQTKVGTSNNLKILIFNWRDTKHVWAGGAEVYLHELAKRWVGLGHTVTIFCSDDRKGLQTEKIDGVEIVRKGGFLSVYFWAPIYYLFKFRGKFDVVIDSENGVPFFTPLYVWKKKFLLIYHVHHEVFNKSLHPVLSSFASFLEGPLTSLIYRNTEFVTISPSSKTDILDFRLTKKDPKIVYSGIDHATYHPGTKSPTPLVSYVGRLMPYKSLHVFIESAKEILESLPDVEFVIGGEGQEMGRLQNMVAKLGLAKSFTFTGRLSEKDKISLYQKAWVFVNPSLIEGWGITTIEANACGTPVVASNVPGLRDSVHNPHSGFLVPYGNSSAMARKIRKIITNKKLRSQMSNDSIEWAKNFNWDISAEKWINIFKN